MGGKTDILCEGCEAVPAASLRCSSCVEGDTGNGGATGATGNGCVAETAASFRCVGEAIENDTDMSGGGAFGVETSDPSTPSSGCCVLQPRPLATPTTLGRSRGSLTGTDMSEGSWPFKLATVAEEPAALLRFASAISKCVWKKESKYLG